jgi:Arm DNA-binding domain
MPRIRLTKSVIDALPTSKSDVVYWDAGYPGFGVKVTPKGRKVFIVLYRTGGAGSRLRKYTIGPYGRVTLHQARVAGQKVFAAKLDGRERRVPAWLNRYIDVYVNQSRPVLLGSRPPTNALWISATTGQGMTTKNIGTLISKVTLATLGMDVSVTHRGSLNCGGIRGNTPHLASALLNHTDPRVTEEHYNRASTVSAAAAYARIIAGFRTR